MTLAMKLDEEREISRLEEKISAIRNGKGKGADDFIISILGIDRDRFVERSNMIDSHSEKDDWDIANTILYG